MDSELCRHLESVSNWQSKQTKVVIMKTCQIYRLQWSTTCRALLGTLEVPCPVLLMVTLGGRGHCRQIKVIFSQGPSPEHASDSADCLVPSGSLLLFLQDSGSPSTALGWPSSAVFNVFKMLSSEPLGSKPQDRAQWSLPCQEPDTNSSLGLLLKGFLCQSTKETPTRNV